MLTHDGEREVEELEAQLMLTYADVCWRMLTYACLTYADVCQVEELEAQLDRLEAAGAAVREAAAALADAQQVIRHVC